jgi:hypothetical protein
LFSSTPVRGYTHGKNETAIASPSMVALLAIAVHGPLLLMQLPAFASGSQTQMFLAKHYASDWFSTWNSQWFGGFSQTTSAPLTQQVVALLSHIFGITAAYMVTQLAVVVLLALAVYRFSRLWTGERTAPIAAIGSIFLGSLAFLVYRDGALPATAGTALAIFGASFLYGFARAGEMLSLVKSVLLLIAAACCDHLTALYGILLFALPTLWLASGDAHDEAYGEPASAAAVFIRGLVVLAVCAVLAGFILAPFWSAVFHSSNRLLAPDQTPGNLLLQGSTALRYWIVPFGLLILALPYLFLSGFAARRTRALFLAFYIALIIGLGATTPVAKFVLGVFYQASSVELFTFWATLLALPLVALMVAGLVDRYQQRAVITVWVAAVLTFAAPLAWMTYHPATDNRFQTDHIASFLNRDNHAQFRYLTLGFGSQFAEVASRTNASTVDGVGDGPMLPEAREFGVSHLDDAKAYGSAGMEALRAVLKHANQYGLKFIFIRDRYYEPLIAFAGWRQVESYENGNVTLWSKEDVPPARDLQTQQKLPDIERTLWGVAPLLCLLLALLLMIATPEREEQVGAMALPPTGTDPILTQEAI